VRWASTAGADGRAGHRPFGRGRCGDADAKPEDLEMNPRILAAPKQLQDRFPSAWKRDRCIEGLLIVFRGETIPGNRDRGYAVLL
jgi:hypothetical protein